MRGFKFVAAESPFTRCTSSMLSFKYFVKGEVWEQRQNLKAFAAVRT